MRYRFIITVAFALLVLAPFAAAYAQEADLFVLKSGPATALPGENVAYSVTITNAGPDAATTVTLRDFIPAGMTYVSDTQTTGPAFVCTNPGVGSGGQVNCTAATLAAGASADFTFTFNIPLATIPGTFFTNIATASSLTFDPNEENDSGTATTSTPPPPQAELSVVKSGPASAAPNADVTYTITVSNGGPDAAATVALNDTLPGTMTFVSMTQDSGPAFSCSVPGAGSGGTITCTIATFNAGSTATFTLVGHIPPGTPSGTSFQNTATVSTDTAEGDTDNNVSTTTLIIVVADVSVSKGGPANTFAGSNISYSVTVTNGGPDAAQNVTFSDPLPAGTTFVSITQNTGPLAGCSTPAPNTNGAVVCTIPTLNNGASAQFTIVAHIASSLPSGTVLSNTATVSTSGTSDTNNTNDTSTVTTTLSVQNNAGVTKSGPATINAGANISYTIGVTNAGPSDTASITLTDNTPPNTTFVSLVSPAGWSCTMPPSGGTGAITCNASTFAALANATFTLTLRVSPSAVAASTISNTATVSAANDADNTNNNAISNATVTTSADLTIAKNGPASATAAGSITYSIVVTNNGPSDAQTVALSDNTPPNTTFTSIAAPAGWSCTTPALGGTGAINCTTAVLAASANATFTLILGVDGAAANGSTISNTATVSSATTDPTTPNTATSSATVTSIADLTITKTGAPTVPAGGSASYTIFVTNNGPADAQNLTLTDVTPPNTTFSLIVPASGWSCTAPASGTSGTVTCTTPSVASGATSIFTLDVGINSSAPNGSTIANTATVTATSPDPTTPNSATWSATVVTSADLSVTKNGPANAAPSSTITYTIAVSNNGPADAASATLTDAVPTGTTFVSFVQNTGPTFSCTNPASGGTGTVTCTIASFAAGATSTFTLVVATSAGGGTLVINTASVSATTPDQDNVNNSAPLATLVAPGPADVAIVKTAGSPTVLRNQNETFTITVTNNGPGAADTVTVTDVIPAGTTFVSATASQGTCTGTTTVTCSMGTIAASASATITLVVQAGATLGPVSNTATVTTSSTDPNPTNNSSTATFDVVVAIPAMSPLVLLLSALALALGGAIALKGRA